MTDARTLRRALRMREQEQAARIAKLHTPNFM